MNMLSFSVILLQIVCGMVGGALSFLFLNWAVYRFQLGLHYRLSDIEEKVAREVKVRAQKESTKARNVEKDLMEQLQEHQPAQPPLTLASWRNSKYGSVQKN